MACARLTRSLQINGSHRADQKLTLEDRHDHLDHQHPPDLEHASFERRDSLIDLVSAARAGDKDAWDALVDRFLPLVTCVIAKHRLPPSDADDVNQIVWLRLVEHLNDLREPLALPGWLATIARNESLGIIRLRGRRRPSTRNRPLGNVRTQSLNSTLS